MVGNTRLAGRQAASALGGIVVGCLGLIAAFFGVQFSGTKTGTVMAVGAVTLPLLFGLSLFAPLVFPFGLYAALTPFDAVVRLGAAATVTKLLGALSAGALLFYIIRTRQYADPDRSVAMWLLYNLWLTSSLFWAIDSKSSLELLPTALLLFGLYAVVSLVRTNMQTMYAVAKWTLLGGAAASVYMLYLYHSGVAIKDQRMWLVTDNVNWNPDSLATALLLPIAIAIMSMVFGRSLFTKIGAFAALAVMLPVIVLTGARGPELGLLVLVIYLIVREPNRARLAWPVGILSVLGLAVAAPALAARWASAFTSGGAGRTDIWRVALLAFKQNWLFGAGFNNFPLAYNRAMLDVFQPRYSGWSRASHNILLGNSVELGVIGLCLLLVAWYVQFRALRSIGPDDPRFRMRLLLEGSILALFVAGLFADVMLEKYVWLAFMLVSLTRNALPAPVPVPKPAVIQGVAVHA